MIGRTRTEKLLKRALSLSPVDETEAVLLGLDEQLTRFANNGIHQHVAETNRYLVVRAASGRRVGVGATNNLTDAGLGRVVEAAVAAARLRPEDPHFPGLADPASVPEVTGFDEATAGCSPAERARAVRVLCQRAEELGCVAAGAFRTSAHEWAVAEEAYRAATELLTDHRDLLDEIAEVLLRQEVIEREEIRALMGSTRERVEPPSPAYAPPAGTPAEALVVEPPPERD